MANGFIQQGLALHQQGRLDEAERCYGKALQQQSDNADALHLSGLIALQRGNAGRACELIECAIQADDQVPDFHFNHALALQSNDQPGPARLAWQQCLRLAPEHADATSSLARSWMLEGNYAAAEPLLARSIKQHPEHPGPWLDRGLALIQLQRLDQAIELLQQAVKRFPVQANGWQLLSDALRQQWLLRPAIAAARKAVELDPDTAANHTALGNALKDAAQTETALKAYKTANKLDPDSHITHFNLGYSYQDLGQLPQAQDCYRQAIQLQPKASVVWFQLCHVRRFDQPQDPDLEQIRQLLIQPDLAPIDQSNLRFGLAKGLDDAADFDAAFEQYQLANDLRGKLFPFDLAAQLSQIEQTIDQIGADQIAQKARFGSNSNRPVFIVGMPRSGTSLVEQILSSHSDFAGAGELNTLARLAARAGPGLERLSAKSSAALCQQYLASLAEFCPDQQALMVSDKMPVNFLHLGFINALFPGAHIVHCRRAPMDTCLSNYFQRFTVGNEWSFDLADLGHYYLAYQKLMQHWRDNCQLRMVEVDYEQLVSEPETRIRHLVEALGLPWQEQCLGFARNRRSVATASSWQVRQPLYKRSINRWRHYEKHLGRLLDTLNQDPLR